MELRQIGGEIWVGERPLWNFGLRWLDIGTRMTVIRLPDGGLVLHSPVEADAATRASIDRVLGWDFDRVTVPHGTVLEHGGRAALAKGYAWL